MSHYDCPCMEKCPLHYAMSLIGGKWKMQILCSLIELVISIRNQIWTNKCKQYQENDHTKSNHRNHILPQTAPCILPIRNALTFLDEILFLGLGGTVEIICTVMIPVQKFLNIRL